MEALDRRIPQGNRNGAGKLLILRVICDVMLAGFKTVRLRKDPRFEKLLEDRGGDREWPLIVGEKWIRREFQAHACVSDSQQAVSFP